MAARDRTLTLKIVGDIADASKSLKNLERKQDSFIGGVKKVGGAIAAGYAAGQVFDFAKNVVDAGATVQAFEDTARTVFGEVGQAAIDASVAAEGIGLSRRQSLESINYLGNLSQATGATAEEALALSTQTQTLAADFAAFSDVPTADVLDAITSATRGEYDALQRYLPTASAATLQAIARSEGLIEEGEALSGAAALQAVYELAVRDGGAALGSYERESGSLAATTDRLGAKWENFQATLGQKVLPLVERAVTWFETKLVPAIGAVVQYVQKHWPPIYSKYIEPTMTAVGDVITGIIDTVTAVWENFGDDIIAFTKAAFEYVWSGVELTLEILGGLIDFVAGIFTGDWERAWQGILDIATGIIDFFIDLPGEILGLVGPIVDAVASIGASIGKGLVNGLIRAWNALDPRVSVRIPSWVPGIGGKGWDSGDLIPDIPYLADGGIVSSPTLAMIGEGRGSEAVIPLPATFGNSYHIEVTAGIYDPTAVGEAIVTAIETYEQENGRALLGVG